MHLKSLQMLEFPKVREILAGFADFTAGRELAEALKPSPEPAEVNRRLSASAEARRLLELETGFSLRDAVDIRPSLAAAVRGKMLDARTLAGIGQTLAVARQVRIRLAGRDEQFPLLSATAAGISKQPQLEAAINRSVTAAGEVLDSASRELSALRQELKDRHRQLRQRLDNIVKAEGSDRFLQDTVVTERQGRYVVPIKNEMRREFQGIIHDVSNTGATVFIEPMATVEMGNELRQLTLAEQREVERILTALSADVAAQAAALDDDIARLAELDLALAKARFARKYRASEPVIGDGKGETAVLSLREARHPLLGEKAVPLTVEIGRDSSSLVITGPNTGGKTVALKCLGLLTLMAQAGIPVPALPESRLPVFDNVYADIGDEQSIEQTLSTFSWHMGNIVNIIRNATPRSLVLLDELGASTDPAEGAALARAILQLFVARGSLLVATTHYGELKAFAFAADGLENASLDFDPATLKPTYHLTVGMPGGSNAFAIAANLGLPPDIIKAAREMLERGPQELESLLAELRDEKQKVAGELDAAAREKEAAETLKETREAELTAYREKASAGLNEHRDRIVTEAAELRRLVREISTELRRARSQENVKLARQALKTVQQDLGGDTWQPDDIAADADAADIKTGDTVLISELGITGTVTAIDESNRQIEVQAGSTNIRMSLESVRPASPSPQPMKPATNSLPSRAVSLELDLRGQRADEVAPAVDKYLDDACLANFNEVRIIHGFGGGVVRQIVRDLLAAHPLVRDYRPGAGSEGGDGATMVSLGDKPSSRRRKK